MLKKIGIALLTLLVILGIWQTRTPAQSYSGLESRLYSLEAEVSQLRAEVSQVESRGSRLSGVPSSGGSGVNGVGTPRPGRGTASSDPMFDRLATLAIELKERVSTLEQQVANLQKRLR